MSQCPEGDVIYAQLVGEWKASMADWRASVAQWQGSRSANNSALCPDLLRYEQIGVADNMRGRVVRAFFWLMRAWPV